MRSELVTVEINESILQKLEYDSTEIKASDRVEFVFYMGGGAYESVLDLIGNPDKRQEIGRRSRAFALKWHSAQAAGRRFDEVYRRLLAGNPLIRETSATGFGHG